MIIYKHRRKCPFCKGQVVTKEFWKYGTWQCGCYNPACKINPRTDCVELKEEAERLWDDSFFEEESHE